MECHLEHLKRIKTMSPFDWLRTVVHCMTLSNHNQYKLSCKRSVSSPGILLRNLITLKKVFNSAVDSQGKQSCISYVDFEIRWIHLISCVHQVLHEQQNTLSVESNVFTHNVFKCLWTLKIHFALSMCSVTLHFNYQLNSELLHWQCKWTFHPSMNSQFH